MKAKVQFGVRFKGGINLNLCLKIVVTASLAKNIFMLTAFPVPYN